MLTFIKTHKAHLGILLLRVSFGLSMLFLHGIPKLDKLTAGDPEIAFYNFLNIGAEASLALAVFAEVFCAALLSLGLFSRISTLPLLFTMFVAFFVVHAQDAFADKEMSFVYLIVYTTLLITGPGKFSMDGFLKSRKKRKQFVA
jgi:putative oxidoreductase